MDGDASFMGSWEVGQNELYSGEQWRAICGTLRICQRVATMGQWVDGRGKRTLPLTALKLV